jgi:hypothetical protein
MKLVGDMTRMGKEMVLVGKSERRRQVGKPKIKLRTFKYMQK